MSACTWASCKREASHPQTAADGAVWANLCEQHDKELSDAVAAGPPRLLVAWVKAQGGPKMAAQRMTRGGA